MSRNWILGAVIALVLGIGAPIAVSSMAAASAITVTTTTDGIVGDGFCSLREAVISANTDQAVGGCAAGSGADTILFSPALPSAAIFTLTVPGTDEDGSLTGDLDIAGTLTIVGAGPDKVIIDGDGIDGVFDVLLGAHVNLSGMAIRNGNPGGAADGGGIKLLGSLKMSNSTVEGNHGGGINNFGGGLVLSDVRVNNNTGGFGILNQSLAALSFNDGLVSGNQGGGISNITSSAALSNLTISGNTTGGGVQNKGASLTHLSLSNSVVTGNSATSGGGIFNEGIGAVVDISTSSITLNMATASGGGIFNNGIMSLSSSTLERNRARAGGGIDDFGGNLSLTNDTLGGNAASDNGGGLYNRGAAILTNVTLSGNTANGPGTGGNVFNDTAQIAFRNTIVANSETEGNCFNSEGFLTSSGHNLDSGNTCGFTANGDLSNTDPLLGPLADNGGPTHTFAPLAGSPAIDAGDNALCPSMDQRGMPRPMDGNGDGKAFCDLGSVEYQGESSTPTPTATVTNTPTPTVTPTASPMLPVRLYLPLVFVD